MNASEYASSIEYPVFFYVSVGVPAGEEIAITPDSFLPVDLSLVEGEIENGVFTATNLIRDHNSLLGYQFVDFNRNSITMIKIYSDKKEWERQCENYF